jgi:hypothetical protein
MTSVELLEKQFKENGTITDDDFKKAKNWHKSEIVKAWDFGKNHGWNTRENEINPHWSFQKDNGESYYRWEYNYVYGQLKND